MKSTLRMFTRMLALAGVSAALCIAPIAGAQEPKPQPKPAPSPYDPPKQPVKRSYFCAEKSDGWYCGENNEPRLYKCKGGFIETSKECRAGCDSGSNTCKPES